MGMPPVRSRTFFRQNALKSQRHGKIWERQLGRNCRFHPAFQPSNFAISALTLEPGKWPSGARFSTPDRPLNESLYITQLSQENPKLCRCQIP